MIGAVDRGGHEARKATSSFRSSFFAMNKIATRVSFVLLVLGGGLLIGILTAPGDWYAGLNKPPFDPPDWIFGPVWTVLYVLIAIAGWRTWETGRTSFMMTLWWVQLFFNFLWSPVFFVLQRPEIALMVILALLTTILLFISRSWVTDRVSALAFIPYVAWVSFASILNFSIVILN